MDIDALRTFLEVNRTRHFGRAADNLYVSQSTVSARIKMLEDQIGMPLFVRQRNNIQLTDAGQRLIRYAENIVTNWVRARQEIGIAEEQHVPLVVGAASSLWDSILQEWIFYLYEACPDLILHAEVQSPDILLRRTLERSMDIAFVFDSPQSGDMECIEAAQVPLVMVSDQPDLNVSQAMQHHYIMMDWGTSFSNTHARYFPDAPIPAMRVMQARLVRDVILKRGGSAYITEPMVKPLLDKGVLFRVNDAPVIERSVYALYHHNHEQLELIKMACDYFRHNTESAVSQIA
ncbi:MAG: LysR family transcriptional regulator [Gammaproteobacteria bacterium]|nr:LysR family transcriptional regulator [Gammaproteobacteria bacterium]